MVIEYYLDTWLLYFGYLLFKYMSFPRIIFVLFVAGLVYKTSVLLDMNVNKSEKGAVLGENTVTISIVDDDSGAPPPGGPGSPNGDPQPLPGGQVLSQMLNYFTKVPTLFDIVPRLSFKKDRVFFRGIGYYGEDTVSSEFQSPVLEKTPLIEVYETTTRIPLEKSNVSVGPFVFNTLYDAQTVISAILPELFYRSNTLLRFPLTLVISNWDGSFTLWQPQSLPKDQSFVSVWQGAEMVACTYAKQAVRTNMSAQSHLAYGASVLWIDLLPEGGGVVVEDSGLYGTAYGQLTGWIYFDASGGGVRNDGQGNLSGTAYSEKLGWIDFDPAGADYVVVNTQTGDFSGFAQGALTGRISFNCASEGSCAVRDYKSQTTWPRFGRTTTPIPVELPKKEDLPLPLPNSAPMTVTKVEPLPLTDACFYCMSPELIIDGVDFGSNQGRVYVWSDSGWQEASAYTSWSDTQIKVKF